MCVFVPIILATSPSDQGETCRFAVYLEDYALDHGITRHNKPQRPPMGITRDNKPQRKHPAPRARDDTYGITEVVENSSN